MSPEETGFLYPFIEADEHDADALLRDLAASASGKAAESRRLRTVTLEALGDDIAAAGYDMTERFQAGGRLYTFGNGEARPTPPPWRRCSERHRRAGRSRPGASSPTRPC